MLSMNARFNKFKCLYREQYNLVWIFDQSSGHNAFPEDALVASHMNVNPGGKQPVMHPGRLPSGQEQQMVDSRGVPKGLRQVLQERGVDTRKMKKKVMVERLQQFDDFKYELNTVQRYLIKDLGHRCISLPKVYMHITDLHIFLHCFLCYIVLFHSVSSRAKSNRKMLGTGEEVCEGEL